MKNSARLVLLGLILFLDLGIPVKGQELTWNPKLKYKNNGRNYFLASENGITYLLATNAEGAFASASQSILKYNAGFDEVSEKVITVKNKLLYLLACYMSVDKQVHIIYLGGNSFVVNLYCDIFDLDGNYVKTVELITKKTDEEKKAGVTNFDWYVKVSPNHLWIAVRFGSIVKLFDKDYKILWKKQLPRIMPSMALTNEGTMIGKIMRNEREENNHTKPANIFLINQTGKMDEKSPADPFLLQFDLVANKLYAVTSLGTQGKSSLMGYDDKNDGAFYTTGYKIEVYSIEDLILLKKIDVPLNKDIVNSINKINPDKGLPHLELTRIVNTRDNEPVLVFETKPYTTRMASGNSTVITKIYYSEDIVLIKLKSDSGGVQKTFRRSLADPVNISANVNAIFKEDKLILLYIDDFQGNLNLNTVMLTKDLKEINKQMIDTWEAHRTAIDVNQLFGIDNNTYLIYSANRNKNLWARIKF